MDYVLDPELAAWGPLVPKMDLNDVAATREAERQVLSQMPPYEAGRRLAVTDAVVPGPPGPLVAGIGSAAARSQSACLL